MLVSLMIIGAQRCGTTTLFDALRTHPQLEACRLKEPEFFSLRENWRAHLDWYHGLFREREGALCFEASTSYTFFPLRLPRVWDSIYDYNPDMKFLYLVRKPIDRIISAYMLYYQRGYTDLPIEQALLQQRDFLDVSRYYTQVMPYVRKFGHERVMIVDFDDITRNLDALLLRIAAWLGIEPHAFDRAVRHSNASHDLHVLHHKYDRPSRPLRAVRRLAPWAWHRLTDNAKRRLARKPELSLEWREVINRVLELEVRNLGPLMGRNLDDWLTS